MMKKLMCALLLLAVCAGAASAESSVLVAYFSATGHTAPIAEYIAQSLGADLYEIVPAEPYTDADLNYNDSSSRATAEQNDSTCRPALAGELPDMSGYDIVIIGHPIWWGQAPKLIYTFIESCDLSGKTVTSFCTSASSGLGSSADNLRADLPDSVNWLTSRRFPIGASDAEVQEWLDEVMG